MNKKLVVKTKVGKGEIKIISCNGICQDIQNGQQLNTKKQK